MSTAEIIIVWWLVLPIFTTEPLTKDVKNVTSHPVSSYKSDNRTYAVTDNNITYVFQLKTYNGADRIEIHTDIVALAKKHPKNWTVEELIQYFPIVRLLACNQQCIGETNIPLGTIKIPFLRCESCYCDESCSFYGDCCSVSAQTSPKKGQQCINKIKNTTMEKGLLMMTSCPDNYTDNHVRDLCELPSDGCGVLPVTSSSGITYLNRYCAVCNHDKDYDDWQLNMEAGNNKLDLKDVITDVFMCRRRTYIKKPPLVQSRTIQASKCDPGVVTSCPTPLFSRVEKGPKEISQLEKLEKIYQSNCYRLYNPIHISKDRNFRNIFCYICRIHYNSLNPDIIGLTNVRYDADYHVSVKRREYVDPNYQIESNSTERCSHPDDWFHPYQKRCYRMFCSDWLVLQAGECVPMQGDRELLYHVLITIDNELYKLQMELITNRIKKDLQTLGISKYVISVGILEETNSNYSSIRLYFALNVSQFNKLSHLLSFVHEMWTFGQQITYDSILSPSWRTLQEIVSDALLLRCCKQEKFDDFHYRLAVELNDQYLCSHILQNRSDFEDVGNGSIILFNTSLTLNNGQYYNGPKGFIKICVDALNDKWQFYLQQSNSEGESPPEDYPNSKLEPHRADFEHMFSIFQLTILVVSLLPLFLTFLTYRIFPDLRTLPAQNNMALVVCLFLAQLLLVIGSYLPTDTIVCKIFGVLIHYSWLCVVFWMNVCSFHMFSVFRALKAARSSSSPKRMKKYALYANGLPLLIVVMVIALS
ncbi:hypothetical protein SNE40_010682 [Patella caerulea]|uniref:G-protein coupled receptors family 2 profile 2 domain-containing protein n=1 Tax=Patella caerulea TaxID=87958 RepID=A0AAN8JSH3_PATCE